MKDWLSTKEAADILEVSERTLLRQLADPDFADEMYGAGNWRKRPIVRRTMYQLKASRVAELAPDPPAE